MVNPLISVVVPTFERSDLLGRTLESIFSQTWKNIEIVVVDDNIPGSEWESKTAKLLENYKDRKNLIHLRTSGKTGGGAARNFAIKRSTGDYVAFLDDDDQFVANKLERQLSFMLENDLDGSYHDVEWRDPNEKIIERRSMDYTSDFSTEGLLKAHILHSIAPTGIYMFKREKLISTEGFGEVPSGQDFILMLRCIESKMKIGYMPGVYTIQYIHSGARISVGASKMKGEKNLYEMKHNYFYLLTKKEKSYVRFRHYAVFAFANMRNKKYFTAGKYAFVTLATSPYYCYKEARKYFGSKRRDKV